MLFHTFKSQAERRSFGGSAFVEIQFCKKKAKTKIEDLVKVSCANHWQDDSLHIYIDDIEIFVQEYGNIFNCGIYNNLDSGIVDICGINYYKADFIGNILAEILVNKPTDYEILIEWLNKARDYNGFYVLGV